MAVLSQKLNPLFSECGFEVFPGYSCLEKLTPIPAPEPTNPSPKGIKKLLEVSTSPLSVTHGTERLKAFPINKPSGRHDKVGSDG